MLTEKEKEEIREAGLKTLEFIENLSEALKKEDEKGYTDHIFSLQMLSMILASETHEKLTGYSNILVGVLGLVHAEFPDSDDIKLSSIFDNISEEVIELWLKLVDVKLNHVASLLAGTMAFLTHSEPDVTAIGAYTLGKFVYEGIKTNEDAYDNAMKCINKKPI